MEFNRENGIKAFTESVSFSYLPMEIVLEIDVLGTRWRADDDVGEDLLLAEDRALLCRLTATEPERLERTLKARLAADVLAVTVVPLSLLTVLAE